MINDDDSRFSMNIVSDDNNSVFRMKLVSDVEEERLKVGEKEIRLRVFCGLLWNWLERGERER